MAKYKLFFSFSGEMEYEADSYDEACEYFDDFSNDELLEEIDSDCLDIYDIEELED